MIGEGREEEVYKAAGPMDVNAFTAVKVRGGTEGVAGCVSMSAPWVCDASVTCNDWVKGSNSGNVVGQRVGLQFLILLGLSMGFMFHVCNTIVTTIVEAPSLPLGYIY